MIFVGDLHGGYPSLLYHIVKRAVTNEHIIQVGDWGLGFAPLTDDIQALQRINAFLKERDIKLYIIRGNHDNKWYWTNGRKLGLTHVLLVEDYEVLTIEGQRILFIGGGISIDRSSRTIRKDYWPDEVFVYRKKALIHACRESVDIVVSHIAPASCWPYVLTPVVEHYINREQIAGKDLKTALLSEREQMDAVLAYVAKKGLKEWYYGHYHQSVTTHIQNISLRCLDEGELYYRR
ncbi:metallophosphoesterase [Chitinophaga rhizophila]|uniref:Metallophosphoesterase family protein n=1 Tax=Chitinophaga rhizophila TaxID=2866212 RepID=A0ABS7GFP6_9BACT|nr:metallophosphoesterase family protein [Chitinophaga rhizophila]MBW8685940.1 metallophosphoesterase family protein [Chitinophaga rhizophila]